MNYNTLKNMSKHQLISLCLTTDAKRRKGWFMYYQTEEMFYDCIQSINGQIIQIEIENESEVTEKEIIPTHIKEEFKKLIQNYENFKKECPICLNKMSASDMHLTNCGHIFHKHCYDVIELPRKCPVCRKLP